MNRPIKQSESVEYEVVSYKSFDDEDMGSSENIAMNDDFKSKESIANRDQELPLKRTIISSLRTQCRGSKSMRNVSDDRPFGCDICFHRFKQKNTLKQHILTHTGQRPHPCDLCSKTFTQVSALQRHRALHDIKDKSFPCHLCPKTFRQLNNFKRHLNLHTGEGPRYQCEICSRSFPRKDSLTRHVKQHLPTREILHCRYCDSTFAFESTLLRHERNHREKMTKPPPWKSVNCKWCYDARKEEQDITKQPCSFCERNNKHRMYDSHNSIEHECKVCGEYFPSQARLNKHYLVHRTEVSDLSDFVKIFECHECGRLMTNRTSLVTHLKGHDRKHLSVAFDPRESRKLQNDLQHLDVAFPRESRKLQNDLQREHDDEIITSIELRKMKDQNYQRIDITTSTDEKESVQNDLEKERDQNFTDESVQNLEIGSENNQSIESVIETFEDGDGSTVENSSFTVNVEKIEDIGQLRSYVLYADDETTQNDDEQSSINEEFNMYSYEGNSPANDHEADYPIDVALKNERPVIIIYSGDQTVQSDQCETPVNDRYNFDHSTAKDKQFENNEMEEINISEFLHTKIEEDDNEPSDQETVVLSEVEEKDALFLLEEQTISALNSPRDFDEDFDIEEELHGTEHEMQPLDRTLDENLSSDDSAKEVLSTLGSPTIEEIHSASVQGEEEQTTERKNEIIEVQFDEEEFIFFHEEDAEDKPLQPRPYSCHVCKKSYASHPSLKRHFKTSHTNYEKVKCPHCPKTFQSQDALLKHVRALHGKRERFECAECGKTFNHKYSLQCHLRLHAGDKPFACEHCDMRFAQKQNLYAHAMKHRPDVPFQCSICDKGFYAKSVLNKHMLIHLNEKKFQCKRCNKSFIQKNQLLSHEITHGIVNQTFPCGVCDKVFARKATFLRHVKLHDKHHTMVHIKFL